MIGMSIVRVMSLVAFRRGALRDCPLSPSKQTPENLLSYASPGTD